MKRIIWGMAVSVLAAGSADAALVSRAGGQAYYDTALDITWLADANAGAGSIYDDSVTGTFGTMTWSSAQSWIGSLNTANHLGVSNWRLPLTAVPDGGCDYSSTSWGYGCTGSEMGHLYYVDGISTSTPSPFLNVGASYWSDTPAEFSHLARYFFFNTGYQYYNGSKNNELYAWAVSPGDIGGAVVPAPAAVWLLGSALGVLGMLKRRVRGAGTAA